jgi:hypothetical protein
MYVTNLGVFAYDLTGSTAGLEFPRGSGKKLAFAAGLWVGARVGSETLLALGGFQPEYSPGPIDEFGGYPDPTDPQHRVYKIVRGDTTSTDYLEWPFDLGAPTDPAGNPLLTGEQTLWCVYNDANPDRHVALEGGTDPLGIEIRQTAHAFTPSPGRGNMVILEFEIINRLANTLDSAYISLWCDPDIGSAGDDLSGCDTLLDLGFAYNGFTTDAVYDSTPPCMGIKVLEGIKGGGGAELRMMSFRRYVSGYDPVNPGQVYNMMRGLTSAGDPVTDPTTGLPTAFDVPGDPVASTGWTDAVPGDRRFMVNMGPFSMQPGDTARLAAAVVAGGGRDRLDSITNTKLFARLAQAYYDSRDGGLIATDFEAIEDGPDIVLAWTAPVRDDLRGIAIRYSRVAYPKTPIEGTGIPCAGGGALHESVTLGETYYYSAFGLLEDGSNFLFGLDRITPGAGAGVPGDRPGGPAGGADRRLALLVDPNPTAGAVRFACRPAGESGMEVDIYSVSGRLVKTLAAVTSGEGPAGIIWDLTNQEGERVPAGVYLVNLRADGETASGKVVILD